MTGLGAGPVLLLAPHPDDEVVGFATLVARHRAAGGRVAVLFLTEGVPPAELLWPWERRRRAARVARRQAEAEAACDRLGAEIVAFRPLPCRRLKDDLPTARTAVAAAVAGTGAGSLWVPAYEGGHQDHDAANCLAARFAAAGLPVWEAPLYSFAGGRLRRQEFLTPPHQPGVVIRLSPAERRAKRDLLALYASERANLRQVGLEREALGPLPCHDYSQPPHPGRCFYQRYHWVPFRHPRIDFTSPDEVCARLADAGLAAGRSPREE